MGSIGRHWRKLLLVACLGAVGSVLPTAVATAQQPKAASQLAIEFIAARNSANVDAAVALFAPGGTFTGAGTCAQAPCSGAALRNQLEQETQGKIEVVILGTEADGASARVRVRVVNDRIKSCGVSRVLATETYTAANGQLTSVVATLDVSDPETARLLTCPPPGTAPVAPAPPATGTGEAMPRTDDSLESLGLVLCLLALAGGTLWVRARKIG